MKPFTIFLFFALLPTIQINAQVGIGTTTPNASLDIKSSNEATPTNTDGILIPKIEEYPATDPTASQDGMMVFATGNGSVTKGFYYWDNGTTSWISFSGVSGTSIQKLDDLLDAKSDSDGSDDGSSIFIGVDAGLNDDGSNNRNVGVGYQVLYTNTSGSYNSSFGVSSMKFNTNGHYNSVFGYHSLLLNLTGNYNSSFGTSSLRSNTTGNSNVGIGYQSLLNNTSGNNNVALGSTAGGKTNGNNNVFLGFETGSGGATDTKEGSVFVGYQAGYAEDNSNRLYIENSASINPLIYGEFDNNLLRVNGDFEVKKPTDVSMTAKSPFGNKSSLKLFETNGSSDYGFEFEYDGSADKFYLWSRTFSGNEGIRMTWLKNGRVGISTTAPNALLDVSSTNPAAPKNTDGMLVPRINAFPSSNPTANQNGMLVFLTTDNKFYYWRNSSTSWVSVSSVQKLNDLVDGKSDNDGSQNGSSVYLGINSGITDDSSDNRNVGIGFQTLQTNSIGSTNTALGYQSMKSNTGGFNNVAVGTESLFLNTSGNSNVALGDTALYSNTTGDSNIAIGWESLKNNTTSDNNIAIGYRSLYANSIGTNNVAIGKESLRNNSSGFNTAIGSGAIKVNTTGNSNTGIGYQAMKVNTTGDNNVAIGRSALQSNTTFDFNTAIGSGAAFSTNGFSNTTAIGAGSSVSSPNQVRLGNASVVIIGGNAPWSNFSDKRIKTNIKEDIVGLEFIKKLRPVSYNLDMDAIARFEKTPDSLRLKDAERLKAKEIQTGFIAQEVETAAKEVGFNFHGVVKPYTKNDLYALSYSEFVVPLVKAVQEQQTEIEALKKEIAEIKALLLNK